MNRDQRDLFNSPQQKANGRLLFIPEEKELSSFLEDSREFLLHPNALSAWRTMKQEAKSDSVNLLLISAFRSVKRQTEIIEAKRQKGLSDKEIFKYSAPPGFSEHHSGRALDIGTDGFPHLQEAFEDSEAFRWLTSNAQKFGFSLSYPRNNEYGIGYEPWHWLYRGDLQIRK